MKDDIQKSWSQLKGASKLSKIIRDAGYDAYIIGGAVRDILLGHLPKDFDIVTNAEPGQVEKLPGLTKSKFKDTAQAFGVTRVVIPVNENGVMHDVNIEVATYRKDVESHLGRQLTKVEFSTLEDDILRRDLTINALAYDPNTNQLVDLVNGIHDLETKTIRFIGDPLSRIQEDPLRILRAIRLKNQLGFHFERQTEADIHRAVKQGFVKQIAPDRMQTELTKMLVHASRISAIADLDSFGIIHEVLPELLKMKGTSQPNEFHMEGDVWEHTLLALQYLPSKVSARLVWAVLLHDIGKPETIETPDETGDRIRFNKHYLVGAKIAEQILKRLNFSNKFISNVYWMINNHIGIDTLPAMKPSKQKMFLSHEAYLDLFELHKADAYSAWNKHPDGTIEVTEPEFHQLEELWKNYEQKTHRAFLDLKRDLGIDGEWIMKKYDLKPGEKLGLILSKINDAYIDGDVINEKECKKLVETLLATPLTK